MVQASLFLAEVSDKEPSLTQLWVIAAIGVGGAFFLSRWRRWAVGIVLLPAIFWALHIVRELQDPWIGPALMSEQGMSYILQSYLTALLPLAAVFFYVWRSRFRHE